MILERTLPSQPRSAERTLILPLGSYWHRLALLAIVALAGALNFAGLSREGYDNEFYAAAVKSMSESWHNFFFNSFDPGGFVTIDKPPLGFWFQVASVKIFGFNGVSLLLPQALAGVLAVLVLYHFVARTFGRAAGLIAALALAITPISVVTSRNNTIDSTLVFFLLLAAWAVLRAAETGKLRWLLLSAVIVGLGLNIKMLEAYLVVPALGLMYLLGTHESLRRRLGNLALALVVLLAVSLSWATAVDLTPAGLRPWVDSTTTNSELNLALDYNGLQRLTGNSSVSGGGQAPSGTARAASATTRSSVASSSTGATRSGTTASVAGNGGNAGFGPGNGGGPGGIGENGPTGVFRLLDTQLGSQIGWFLPLAFLGLVFALWRSRPRRPLPDGSAGGVRRLHHAAHPDGCHPAGRSHRFRRVQRLRRWSGQWFPRPVHQRFWAPFQWLTGWIRRTSSASERGRWPSGCLRSSGQQRNVGRWSARRILRRARRRSGQRHTRHLPGEASRQRHVPGRHAQLESGRASHHRHRRSGAIPGWLHGQ